MTSSNKTFGGSFWTPDYKTGVNALHNKMIQGFYENNEISSLLAAFMTAEESYGISLQEVDERAAPRAQGFGRDDGASLRKAYEGMVNTISSKGQSHIRIAQDIRNMALEPFARWAVDHETKVKQTYYREMRGIKQVENLKADVNKCARVYRTKNEALQSFKSTNIVSQNPIAPSPSSSTTSIPSVKIVPPSDENTRTSLPRRSTGTSSVDGDAEDDEAEEQELEETVEEEVFYEIGDRSFSAERMAAMLQQMLDEIPQAEFKARFYGQYKNVMSGDNVVEWITGSMKVKASTAEDIGQDLIDAGFMKQVAAIGNTFLNSSKTHYAWRPKAYEVAGRVDPGSLNRTSTFGESILTNVINAATGTTTLSGDPIPENETPYERVVREEHLADEKYKAAVVRLDNGRCELEEGLLRYFQLMESYETARLEQIKHILNVFSISVANIMPQMRKLIDELSLYHETIQPEKDLRYLIESYKTGLFAPHVTVYENALMSNDSQQTFGIRLEDKFIDEKSVPKIITRTLQYLDTVYANSPSNMDVQDTWLVNVSLKEVHDLRRLINTGKPLTDDEYRTIFETFPAPVVAAVLKLYFYELPRSLIDPSLYDALKDYYSRRTPEVEAEGSAEQVIIGPLSTILVKLPESNAVTLKAITKHLQRLIKVTMEHAQANGSNAGEEFELKLAHEMSRVLIRPLVDTPLTVDDRFGYRFLLDLFHHGRPIMDNARRARSADVSRRQQVEERNRQMLQARGRDSPDAKLENGKSRNRLASPTPGHNRVPSVKLVLTPSSRKRASSNVSSPSAAVAAASESAPAEAGEADEASDTLKATPDDAGVEDDEGEEANHRASISSSFSQGRSLVGEESGLGDVEEAAHKLEGVTLVDRPMDDF
ncbi:hypothetical protein BZA70DRAFT_294753 [Myxozyma melibiosi]|uniref:Rho-GAP domain-containing protein n=1 Tax=Myxozyma melibiosi TaxID=54550 RepID=A0ABR1F738_9ASCO